MLIAPQPVLYHRGDPGKFTGRRLYSCSRYPHLRANRGLAQGHGFCASRRRLYFPAAVACGKHFHPDFHGGELPVAPSAIPADGEVYTYSGKKPLQRPRALETHEIPGIVEQFRRGAINAKEAGFDGVEISMEPMAICWIVSSRRHKSQVGHLRGQYSESSAAAFGSRRRGDSSLGADRVDVIEFSE